MFYGHFEDKDVERNADEGGLAYEVSKESKDSMKAICIIFGVTHLWLLVSWS